jgi:hypothetical protein
MIESNGFLTRSTYSELMAAEGINVQDLPCSIMKIIEDSDGVCQIQTSTYSPHDKTFNVTFTTQYPDL